MRSFATQYASFESLASPMIVIRLPEVVKLPLVNGEAETEASPPFCSTVAEQSHPPLEAGVQLNDE